jgi:rRNA-processing protein FCF1
VSDTPQPVAICDANVLIDYFYVDDDLVRELVRYWGAVMVPDMVMAEVHGVTFDRAIELGLTIIETPSVLPIVGGLSLQDRSCLHYVIAQGWTCIANDRKLRKECVRNGGQVVWGLEMLLRLVASGQVTKDRARDLGRKISEFNPEIGQTVLNDFEDKLDHP